jgi:hypothetical protein
VTGNPRSLPWGRPERRSHTRMNDQDTPSCAAGYLLQLSSRGVRSSLARQNPVGPSAVVVIMNDLRSDLFCKGASHSGPGESYLHGPPIDSRVVDPERLAAAIRTADLNACSSRVCDEYVMLFGRHVESAEPELRDSFSFWP